MLRHCVSPWRRGGDLEVWDPLQEVQRLVESFTLALEGPGPLTKVPTLAALRGEYSGWTPEVDIQEAPKEIVVSAVLPGMTKNDMHVEISDDRLRIRGERKLEQEKEKNGYRLREQAYGAFSRSFALPATVNPGAAKATYKDGVLTVHLPKTEEVQPHQVQVE